MKVLIALITLALVLCFVNANDHTQHQEALEELKNLFDKDLITKEQYIERQEQILDDLTKFTRTTPSYPENFGSVLTEQKMNVSWSPEIQWLVSILDNSMPKSYSDELPYGATGSTNFWNTYAYLRDGAFYPTGYALPFDSQIAIQERALTHVGLNLYDGGVWSVALTLAGLSEVVEVYNRGVLYPSTTGANPFVDGLVDIRADKDIYQYGCKKIPGDQLKKITLPGNMTNVHLADPTCCGTCCDETYTHQISGAYYYRMIGPSYRMADPFNGGYGWTWKSKPAGPNNDTTTSWNLAGIIHWNDWKPITGENVWGAILAPMQLLFLKNCGNITKFENFGLAPPEVQLALSVLPALEALQAPLGAIYHCPNGTEMFPPDPDEATNVSNENHFSAWGALAALNYVLENYYTGTNPSDPVTEAKTTVKNLMDGLKSWFGKYLLSSEPINGNYYVYQGGHVTCDGQYNPQKGTQGYAIDCQTWGLTNVGQKFFDASYGSGRAMEVWRGAKKLSGVYINGELAGVGYTLTNGSQPIWSGEWSLGAVNMCKKLAKEYASVNPSFAAELQADADSMMKYMMQDVVPCADGTWCSGGLKQKDGSFLYANKRFFIPWGWYANPIGATSSTGWAVMMEYDFNPFELGGGSQTKWWSQQCPNVDPSSLQPLWDYYDNIFN